MASQQADPTMSSTMFSDEAQPSDWSRFGWPILVGMGVLLLFALVQVAVYVLPESNIWKRITGYRRLHGNIQQQDQHKQKDSSHCRMKCFRDKSRLSGRTGSGGKADSTGETNDASSQSIPEPPSSLVITIGSPPTPPVIHNPTSLLVIREDATEGLDRHNQVLWRSGQDNVAFDGPSADMTSGGSPGRRERPVARVTPVVHHSQFTGDHRSSNATHSVVVEADVHIRDRHMRDVDYQKDNYNDIYLSDPDEEDPRYEKFKALLFTNDMKNDTAEHMSLMNDLRRSSMDDHVGNYPLQPGGISSVDSLVRPHDLPTSIPCMEGDPRSGHTNKGYLSSQEHIHTLSQGLPVDI